MPLPPKLETLARDAGLTPTKPDSDTGEYLVDLGGGATQEVCFISATGAPEEFQAVVVMVPGFVRCTVDSDTGNKWLSMEPAPGEFLNELLVANAQRGIGAFLLTTLQGDLQGYNYCATISLLDMTPAGLKAIVHSIAATSHEYEEKLSLI